MKKLLRTLCLLGLALCAIAADYYVATNGNDASNGSAAAPWASIQFAADRAGPGDTVHVRAGDYTLSPVNGGRSGIASRNSGTASARIRFVSEPRWAAKLHSPKTMAVWDVTGSYVDVEGFEMRVDADTNMYSYWGSIGLISGSGGNSNTGVRFIGNHVIGTSGEAIGGGSPGGTLEIIGNVIENTLPSAQGSPYANAYGIYVSYGDGLIANNVIRDVHYGSAIVVYHKPQAWTIVNNTIHRCELGIHLAASSEGPVDNALVANNVLSDIASWGIMASGAGSGNRIYRNLVSSAYAVQPGSGDEQGTVRAEPLYVDASAADFHLRSGSPAIDGGMTIALVANDFDGKPRSDGACDLGAFEYGSAGSNQPALSINLGGNSAGAFAADSGSNGGRTYGVTSAIDTSGVANPAPQAVYQSERYGNFSTTVTDLAPGATYVVRLHFAEIYWSGVGQRVFDVAINGSRVLANFDIVAAAGGKNKAIVREFATAADASGAIVVSYLTLVDNAKGSGIDVVRDTGTGLREGGFESPKVGEAGTWSNFRYAPTGSAWTISAGAGITGNGSGFTNGNSAAPEGVQVAFLQGDSSISQSVTIGAGTYQISMLAAQRQNWQSSFQYVSIRVDGRLVGVFVPGSRYQRIDSTAFTVNDGRHVISIDGMNLFGGDNTAFVDQVTLDPAAASALRLNG